MALPNVPQQIDLKNAIRQFCSCGAGNFLPAINLYIVSALVSPNGQELTAQVQVLICRECGKTYGEKSL